MRRALRMAVAAALLIPALADTPGHAQAQAPEGAGRDGGQPAAPQMPTFRTGVNFVRVDAIVTDRNGNPVSDLQPQDFEVTEQDQPQKVETFKLISLDGGLMPGPDGRPREIRSDLDEEREAARDDVRLFAIFLDDYHVRRDSSIVARNQIARFVETQLGPSDMIGLMYPLESISAVRMTRNHDAIVRAIQQFEGRKYDYRARNSIEERYQYYPAETVEKIRNQVSLSAIRGLIIRLGGLKEGRKALILVSEGFTAMLPPQMRDPNAAFPGILNPDSRNPLAGTGNQQEDRAAMIASWDMDLELRELYTVANRYNVSIYTVDPRGLAGSEFGIDQSIGVEVGRQYLNSTMETLRTLSTQTDGHAIVNTNDLATGMRQIVRDTSVYYLLGYNSTFTAADGKFHEIKVRVKRPGVQVRARRGYWAMNREEVAAATAPPRPRLRPAVENALNAATAATRARVIRSWIGTERGESGRTKVTFVWEPVLGVPGQVTRESDRPSQVALIAAGSDGSPYFRGRIPAASDGGRRATFEVPPGTMQLRVSVEGSSADVLDSETREITVPDLTLPQTFLSTPEIFRARTVREMQQLKADPRPLPTLGREFGRADRLLVRVKAYGPGSAAPTVTARLLNRAGETMLTLPVAPPEAAGGASHIEMPLAALAASDYIIEIGATGAGGDVQELVGFRVVG